MVEQLAGTSVPASALETLVLPGRVPGYQPAMLDELTAAGEVVWSGAGALPGSDGWIVLAPAAAAPLLFPAPGEITMTPLHEAILDALGGGGALFFRALTDRVASACWPGSQHCGAAGQLATRPSRRRSGTWSGPGRLTNDTLAPLRTMLGAGRPQQRRPPGEDGQLPPR